MLKQCQGCGWTIDDVRRSGRDNPDSKVGVYAGCARCYEAFGELFQPLIDRLHRHDWTEGAAEVATSLPAGFVRTSRIRLARNLSEFPFPASMTLKQRVASMDRVAQTISDSPLFDGTFFALEPSRTFVPLIGCRA